MSKSNEQTAIEIEGRIPEAREEFNRALTHLLAGSGQEIAIEAKQALFLEAQRRAVAFFNLCEQSVADSSLLGAHEDPMWAANKAETSLGVLEVILATHISLSEMARSLELPEGVVTPSSAAYAGMQRLAKEHLPEKAADIEQRFAARGLPIDGFRTPIASKRRSASLEIVDGNIRARGLESSHAADVLRNTSQVRKTDQGVTAAGAFKEGDVVEALKNLAPPKSEESIFSAIKSELRKSPVAIAVRIVGALIATVLIYYLAKSGCAPFAKDGTETPTSVINDVDAGFHRPPASD